MSTIPPPLPAETTTETHAHTGPPRLPAEFGADAESWRGALRHFHLTGEIGAPLDSVSDVAFEPTLLADLLQPESLLKGWPVLLPEQSNNGVDGQPQRLAAVLEAGLAGLGASSLLAGETPRLVLAFQRVLDSLNEVVALGDVADEATAAFRSQFELSDAAGAAFDEDLAKLKKGLPEGGLLIGLGACSAIELHAWTLRRERARRVTAFVDAARGLRDRLGDLLKIDDRRGATGRNAVAMAGSLGGAGQLFDATALAGVLPAHRGTERMSVTRRGRVETNRAVLAKFVDDAADADDLILVHGGILDDGADAAGARVERADDPLAAAAGLFDEQVDRMVEVFKAVRVARLEVAEAYDDELHGASLDRFCWQGLDAEELLLVPTVVALETANRIQDSAMGSLSRLLHSGRPVQVLALEDTTDAPREGDRRLPTSHGAPLGYRLVAHREAYVLQASLASPDHLISGLGAMSRALRPAVALVARPAWDGPWPWLELAAAHQGRGTPTFSYDPDAGDTFADRFVLGDNPSPAVPWPTQTVEVVDAEGAPEQLQAAFTFADAAAAEQAWRGHLQLVPAAGWSDEMAPVAEWVEATGHDLPLALPYVLVTTAGGDLGRAVLTRELAYACRDRRQGWRILQELSGVDNVYATRAGELARAEAKVEAKAEVEALQAAHAAELDRVRAEAAGEAMEQLAAVLLNLDSALPVAAAGAPAAAPVAAAATAAAEVAQPAAAAPVEEEEEEESVSFDDPFVDTPLCTSCNECTGINPELFKYDDNKQAYIADPSAGTFDQLVKAAEKCPALCIHPGKPRAGDSTANDDMLARASKFN